MNVIAIEQLTSIELLAVFLFGIALGVIGGAVYGSKRGALLVPAADGLLSAGARVIYGVYNRDDDGYLESLFPSGRRRVPEDTRTDHETESHGQELDR